MDIDTEPFRTRKGITQAFRCGMVTKPFLRRDQCSRIAVVEVTPVGLEAYRNYRIRYGKYTRCRCNIVLPIMMRPLLCEKHLNLVRVLPNNPRDAHYNVHIDDRLIS